MREVRRAMRLGEYLRGGMMGIRASQIWKSVPTSVKDFIQQSVTTLHFIDLLALNSEKIPGYQEFSWRWQR